MTLKIKESGEDRIGPDGMEALFTDLDISPASVTALILAWKLSAGMNIIFPNFVCILMYIFRGNGIFHKRRVCTQS